MNAGVDGSAPSSDDLQAWRGGIAKAALVVGLATAVALVSVATPGDARAQGTCAAETMVHSSIELAIAISCYDEQTPAGDHTITLARAMEVPLPRHTITQPDPAHTLTINGNGFRLNGRGYDEGQFTVEGAGEVQLWNVTYDAFGGTLLETQPGAGKVSLINSVTNARILVNGGEVSVRHSTAFAGAFQIANSRVTGYTEESDSGSFRPWIAVTGDGSLALSNATISGVQVRADGAGAVTVSNSTMINLFTSVLAGSGSVEVESSILIGVDQACAQGLQIIDLGSNLTSDAECGPGFMVMSEPEQQRFGPFAPGCGGTGCTPLYQLLPSNPAIDVGNCVGVTLRVGEIGDLTSDGKATERPQGPECDAGSDERVKSCFLATEVFTADQLDAAIECFNFQVPQGSHSIVLGAPIGYSKLALPVTLDDPNLSLTIDGRGEAITTTTTISGGLFSVEGDSRVVFADMILSPTVISQARAVIGLEATGRLEFVGADVSGGIEGGRGTVLVSRSTIRDSDVGLAGRVLVINKSLVRDNGIGLLSDRGSVTVVDSLIVDSGTGILAPTSDVDFRNSVLARNSSGISSDAVVRVQDSIVTENFGSGIGTAGHLLISGSEISFNDTGALVVDGRGSTINPAAAVSNSTFFGNSIGLDADGLPMTVSNSSFFLNGTAVDATAQTSVTSSLFINFENSILSNCMSPIDGQANFALEFGCGDSFEPFAVDNLQTFGDLVDNGCLDTSSTPWGCPRTVALLEGNPALDSGLCQQVPISLDQRGAQRADQRGVEREPSACDAGSYEEPRRTCRARLVTIDMSTGASGQGTEGDDVILGTSDDDTIVGLGGNDVLCGGAGNDNIEGNEGDDVISGGEGKDVLRGGPGMDVLAGDDGDDRVLGGIDDDTMFGGQGNDFLGGFGGDDQIFGGAGADTIFGGFGADDISGEGGADRILGLIGDDKISGGPGNDILNGDRGNDLIIGDAGDDVLNGGNANDELRGNAGDDSLNGGKADDILIGGVGTDSCIGNNHFNGDTADASCERIFGVP